MNTRENHCLDHESNDQDFVTSVALFFGLFGSILMVGLAAQIFSQPFALFGAVLSGAVTFLLGKPHFRQRSLEVIDTKTVKSSDHFEKFIATTREGIFVCCLVLVSLWLRMAPFPNLQGGQDQGLYVTFGRVLRHARSVNFEDVARSSLPIDLRSLYDSTHLFSVALLNSAKSTSTIEFYPLHPIFLAITGWIPKMGGAEYLMIAGTGVVLVGRRLALDLGVGRLASNVFSVFLGINPALVFFSRYPVSETLATFYVLLGLTMFVRVIKSEGKRRAIPGIACLLCMNALFYVRWQFFLYVPFFSLVAVGFVIFSRDSKTKRDVGYLIGGICAFFLLSLVYYRHEQPGLFFPVWESISASLPNFQESLALAFCGLLVLLLATLQRKKLLRTYEVISSKTLVMTATFSLSVFVPVIPSMLQLYANRTLSPWGYATPTPADPLLFRYHAIYRLMLFVGPTLFIVALVHPWLSTRNRRITNCISLFAILVWLGVLSRPYVPYLYYYGRYLTVDLVPAFLLLGSIGIVGVLARSRKLGIAVLSVSILYFAAFSGIQLGHRESENPQFFSDLAQRINKADVVVSDVTSQQLFVPLRVQYRRTIFGLGDWPISGQERVEALLRLTQLAKSRGGRLLWLSTGTYWPIPDRRPLTSIVFQDSFITNTDHFRGDGLAYPKARSRLLLPFRWLTNSSEWSVTDVSDGSYLPRCSDLEFTTGLGFNSPFTYGFSGSETLGRWTDGKEAGFTCRATTRKIRSVRLIGDGLVTSRHAQNISISVNGKTPNNQVLTENRRHLDQTIRIAPTDIVSVRLQLPDSASPTELGIGEDGRSLSLFLSRVEFGI